MTKQAVQRPRDSSLSVRLFHACVFAFLVVAMLLGGASRTEVLGPDIVALAALPVMGMAIWRLRTTFLPEWRWPLILLGAVMALPLVQLIPLPSFLWTAMPGRGPIVADLRLASVPIGWAPLSLSPQATWNSFLALLTPAAMLLAGLTIAPEWRRRMVFFVIGFGVVSVLLGAAQLAGGGDSPLRFYDVTNDSAAVGFFSNRNHFASMLACVVVLASAWAADAALGRTASRRDLALALAAVAIAVAGVGMTGSRAGLVLLVPAGLGAIALAWRNGVGRGKGWRVLAVLGAGFVVAAVLVQLTFGVAIDRLQAGFSQENTRLVAAAGSWSAIKALMPFGSGMGTFVPVYKMFEDTGAVINTYINHAHDDWIEVVLEGGLAAVLLLLAFVAWFGRQALRIWRLVGVETGPARAASLCVLLFMVHSLADYPLRSPANAALFALCCATMLAYPVGVRRQAVVRPG